MQRVLKHPAVRLTGEQARTVAMAFAQTPYTLPALAIMPNHIHMIIGYTRRDIRRAIGQIKSEATRALRKRGGYARRSPWTDHGWNVYPNTDDDVQRAIEYDHQNPRREGLRQQRWSFVAPYAAAPI